MLRASPISFTPDELSCIQMLLANPNAFGLSRIELRACSLVVMQADGGGPVADHYVAIVRQLLESINAGEYDSLA